MDDQERPIGLITDAEDLGARKAKLISKEAFERWLPEQKAWTRSWLKNIGFKAKPGQTALIPNPAAELELALRIAKDAPDLWDAAAFRNALPAGPWRLETDGIELDPAVLAQGWALASYRFDRYRKNEALKSNEAKSVTLAIADDAAGRKAMRVAQSVYLARDLINTPASDLGPEELADAVVAVGEAHGAATEVTVGEDLLNANLPAVHVVGRASNRAPRVIDLRWGEASAPKLTLVGKGVCFDTGGLDLKPAAGMVLMKKDMGGAAVMLGLAKAVMAARLPVRLRLLIGAVENSVSSNAYRPGDIVATRKGLSVEIGNTDAEGRVVLADLLTLADEETPELLIDGATLTGAARVALGPDLPALFTNHDRLADDILAAGRKAADPLWRLPLHAPYREMIDSPIADINNAGKGGMAGAITAGLFLQDFVTETEAFAHIDLHGWNPSSRPGRPKGGEASGLRALIDMLETRFPAGS